jgi:hypothetical protein
MNSMDPFWDGSGVSPAMGVFFGGRDRVKRSSTRTQRLGPTHLSIARALGTAQTKGLLHEPVTGWVRLPERQVWS